MVGDPMTPTRLRPSVPHLCHRRLSDHGGSRGGARPPLGPSWTPSTLISARPETSLDIGQSRLAQVGEAPLEFARVDAEPFEPHGQFFAPFRIG